MIKEIFEKMLNKIKFLIEEKKQIVLLSLIVFILILLLILILSLSPKDKKSNSVENPFILSQELKNIDGPEIQNDYIYTRETKDKWTESETEQWFTEPTQKEIDSLKKSNEKIISDILGVAP